METDIKRVGNYTVNTKYILGQGEYGKVFPGVNELTSEVVAVKQIDLRQINNDPYAKQALNVEIEALRKIKHPNVIELKDYCSADNFLYIIQEYCKDGQLKDYILQFQKKPFEEYEKICLDIAHQIAEGMLVIHCSGLIHRDLKPQNVLVHNQKIKIIDFGFAKALTSQDYMARSAVGSPYYMSPQILGKQPYTFKTDIWSFGMVFYELIFKKLPYFANSEEELLGYIQSKPINFAALNCSSLTRKVLQRSLVINEQDRAGWQEIQSILSTGVSDFQSTQVFQIEHTESFSSKQLPNRKSNVKKNIFGQNQNQNEGLVIQNTIQQLQSECVYVFLMGQTMLEVKTPLLGLLDLEGYFKCLFAITQHLQERMKKVQDIFKNPALPSIISTQTQLYLHVMQQFRGYEEFLQDIQLESQKYKMSFAESTLPSQIASVVQRLIATFQKEALVKQDPYTQRQILLLIDYMTSYLRSKNSSFKETLSKIAPYQNTEDYFQYIKQNLYSFSI